eukprot:snap_masked-scaffold_40-processed-gene-2.2-mRNA-1 protein AED:1.00 eAED:1.00 QI:0/0/0/0/1/1/2/0/83
MKSIDEKESSIFNIVIKKALKVFLQLLLKVYQVIFENWSSKQTPDGEILKKISIYEEGVKKQLFFVYYSEGYLFNYTRIEKTS